MKYLFLGGSADGQFIETDGSEYWRVAVSPELSDEYRRFRFRDSDSTEFHVYGFTDDNIKPLARLIAGYQPKIKEAV